MVSIDGRVLPHAIVRLEMDAPGSNIYPAAIDLLDALIPGATHVTIPEGDTVSAMLRAVTR